MKKNILLANLKILNEYVNSVSPEELMDSFEECMKFNDLYIETPPVWGLVGEVEENKIHIPSHEWAPGIWAGSEACSIQIGNRVFTVVKVDLQNRWFTVCPHPDGDIKAGMEIRPYLET